MGLNLRKAHVYEKVGKRQEMQLVAENHIVRIRCSEGGPLFVQSGQVYSEGGDVIKPIPAWFWPEYEKVSPEMRKIVGLALPSDVTAKAGPLTEKPALPIPTKDCPECGKEVKKASFGLHVARHRKADKVS